MTVNQKQLGAAIYINTVHAKSFPYTFWIFITKIQLYVCKAVDIEIAEDCLCSGLWTVLWTILMTFRGLQHGLSYWLYSGMYALLYCGLDNPDCSES